MSITRGLREIRLLKDRIEKTIISTKFVAAVVGVNFIDGKNQEAYAQEVKAYADSIETLIRRRDALKRAIVVSNAKTHVSIGGVLMTVAEAIERKGSIEHEKSLLAKLVQDYGLANNMYERLATAMQSRRDHQLAKLTDEEYRATAAAFDSDVMNTPRIVDPLDIRDRIDKLRERIENFENEVDVILSESNGQTQITVEY